MNELAVELQQVDLIYRRYAKPRDALLEWLLRQQRHETFYALRNISLGLAQGSSLGVVGDNGAGKSTLLRVLAGNLRPHNGRCVVNGSRSALLELGSGLNPEFSGIENARVGLALRGLSQRAINQVLPEVLDFAELGDFVTQPVKHYSSGMVVRLVFAVAAVLEPDVLIVDEALSVGDQYFQKKSLDRMRAILAGGATLVFCSHNLYQLREICQQAVWLEQGQIRMLGEAQRVVDAYQDAVRARCGSSEVVSSPLVFGSDSGAVAGVSAEADEMTQNVAQQQSVPGQCAVPQLLAVRLLHADEHTDPEQQEGGVELPCFPTGQCFTVQVVLDSAGQDATDVHVGVVIRRNDDVQCYGISTLHDGIALQLADHGCAEVRFIIDQLPLLSGKYCLEVWLIDGSGLHVYDARERCCHFRVQQVSQAQGVGMSRLPHRWETAGMSGAAAGNLAERDVDGTAPGQSLGSVAKGHARPAGSRV